MDRRRPQFNRGAARMKPWWERLTEEGKAYYCFARKIVHGRLLNAACYRHRGHLGNHRYQGDWEADRELPLSPIPPHPEINADALAKQIAKDKARGKSTFAREALLAAETDREGAPVISIPEPKTPELERMQKVRERSQEIGDFLEWCRGRGAVLAVQHKHDAGCGEIVKDKDPFVNVINVLVGRDCGLKNDEYAPLTYNIEKLLAEYFQIDLERAESEKRALLDYIRAVN